MDGGGCFFHYNSSRHLVQQRSERWIDLGIDLKIFLVAILLARVWIVTFFEHHTLVYRSDDIGEDTRAVPGQRCCAPGSRLGERADAAPEYR